MSTKNICRDCDPMEEQELIYALDVPFNYNINVFQQLCIYQCPKCKRIEVHQNKVYEDQSKKEDE